jgi:hypothetical protein
LFYSQVLRNNTANESAVFASTQGLLKSQKLFLKLLVARKVTETPHRVSYGCFTTRDLRDPYPVQSIESGQI